MREEIGRHLLIYRHYAHQIGGIVDGDTKGYELRTNSLMAFVELFLRKGLFINRANSHLARKIIRQLLSDCSAAATKHDDCKRFSGLLRHCFLIH